eukprot:905101-Amphidinium_carterae.1
MSPTWNAECARSSCHTPPRAAFNAAFLLLSGSVRPASAVCRQKWRDREPGLRSQAWCGQPPRTEPGQNPI